jgi:hypothetical protein
MEADFMERRISSRAQVDLPVAAFVDGFKHDCRAVDISPTGMVVERTRSLAARTLSTLTALELQLGEARPIRVRARTVWSKDRLQAVRFVVMNDVDRLTIAEHLDRMARLREPLH